MSKSYRKPFKESENTATRVGELVHTDVCSIGVPSLGHFNHFLLFIDDYSRYITVYLLRLKSDTFEAFKHYDSRTFNLTNRHISTLRSDGGGEFFSAQMTAYMQLYGIFQQRSTKYTPQQNGRAERPNRTIVEGASAMLLHANLPKSWWNYAVQTKVWLLNRSPHSKLFKETPYQRWFKKIPDLSTLRVFGTPGFCHIPKQIRAGKLDDKAKHMIFVGYSDIAQAFFMVDPHTQKETLSSEVVFGSENFSQNVAEVNLNNQQNISLENDITLPDQNLALNQPENDSENDSISNDDVSRDTMSYEPSESSLDGSDAQSFLVRAGIDDIKRKDFVTYGTWTLALFALANDTNHEPSYAQAMAGPH